jgi:hypothetical protein
MAVTASKAATAGGRAFASWPCELRAGLPPFCPLILTVCVEVADFMGVRGGITTGWDMVVASAFGIDMFLFTDCVLVSTVTGMTLLGEGLDRVRVPIFSDLERVLRDEGGDECCRYGKDLGEYIIIIGLGPEGVSPVTNSLGRSRYGWCWLG